MEGLALNSLRSIKGAPVYLAKDVIAVDNVNPAFILHAEGGYPCWIFKPITGPMEGTHKARYASVEHAAFCLSMDTPFPVPCTLLVDINGEKGSIQMFVPGANVALEDAEGDSVARDIQATLVFDLLFANEDRNDDNFLVRAIGDGTYRFYAIDNATCLTCREGALEMWYMGSLKNVADFLPEVKALYSPASIAQYKQIILSLNLGTPNIGKWLDYVSSRLLSMPATNLRTLALKLKGEYQKGAWKASGGVV